jgi:membrane protease YdiL (CAAX protease family)
MRYWRHYPKFMQVLLLMLMIFTLASFSNVIAHFTLRSFFGLSADALQDIGAQSSSRVIAAAQYVQALLSLFTFLLSALLFAYLTHPRPLAYLGLRTPGRPVQVPLAVLLLLAAMPLVNQLGHWLQQIDFGSDAKTSYERGQEVIHAMMKGSSAGDLLIHLLLFAALPALGEEFLFRGVIMRLSYNNSKNIHFAVFISAAIFGIAHGSVYNYFPIMLMGILLGYIYYFSGSIWLSVLVHFLNNGLAALGLFLVNKGIVTAETGEAEQFSWYVLLICAVAFGFLFSLLRKQASPLPADWSDDFKGEH